MWQMLLIAFLALASHSQIIRLGAFDCDNGGFNNRLNSIHNAIAPLYRNLPLYQPPLLNLAVKPAPDCEDKPQPRPLPVEIPPVQPQPKLCSCGHHYVSDPAKPVPQHVIRPARHQRETEESSSSSEDKEDGQKCKNCGGKDCKCSLHNPRPRVHPRPEPKPLIKENGKTCDKCKDGKCECSDCKCANCRSESSSEGKSRQSKSASKSLSRGQ